MYWNMESWNHGIMESWNVLEYGIMESWNHGTELNTFHYRLYIHPQPPFR